MVPRKLQVSETFHSISKSRFVSFNESRIFELYAVKSQIFKQGPGISASLKIYHSPPLILIQTTSIKEDSIIITVKH